MVGYCDFLFFAENINTDGGTQANLNNGLGSTLGDIFQLVAVVGAFIIVAVLAYYSTKLIGGAKFAGRRGGIIDVVESRGVGVNSAIQLIRVGSKLILIGVTKDRISYLTEVDPTSVDFTEKNAITATIPFERVFEKFMKKKGEGGDDAGDSDSDGND